MTHLSKVNATKEGRSRRSKGERLGWSSVMEEKKRSLRESVSGGETVKRTNYCFLCAKTKQIIP